MLPGWGHCPGLTRGVGQPVLSRRIHAKLPRFDSQLHSLVTAGQRSLCLWGLSARPRAPLNNLRSPVFLTARPPFYIHQRKASRGLNPLWPRGALSVAWATLMNRTRGGELPSFQLSWSEPGSTACPFPCGAAQRSTKPLDEGVCGREATRPGSPENSTCRLGLPAS